LLKEHCSEMIINKTTEEKMTWSLIKQTVGFTHSPHPALHCFHTLLLSVCTKLREVWPETRRVQATWCTFCLCWKHSLRVSLKPKCSCMAHGKESAFTHRRLS
jgi:hypothetical protein